MARTRDGVAICLDFVEYNYFLKRAGMATELRAEAKLDATESRLLIEFGSGYKFSNANGTPFWRVLVPAFQARAQRLELFGLTPVTYSEINKWRIDLHVPTEARAPLKRAGRAGPIASTTFRREEVKRTPPDRPIYVEPPPAEEPDDPTEKELLLVQDLFNTAIERGFKPKFDGRGRILWFERTYGNTRP